MLLLLPVAGKCKITKKKKKSPKNLINVDELDRVPFFPSPIFPTPLSPTKL